MPKRKPIPSVPTTDAFRLGEALPAGTQTEGARLPRRTRGELIDKYIATQRFGYETGWISRSQYHKRLADLAEQIAGREE